MDTYKTISVRVEQETIQEVETIAKAKDLTITQIVRRLLREFVKKERKV
jgi:antitoxin component of RelBE/YafQ-DinJ toxin-antitoxin module